MKEYKLLWFIVEADLRSKKGGGRLNVYLFYFSLSSSFLAAFTNTSAVVDSQMDTSRAYPEF